MQHPEVSIALESAKLQRTGQKIKRFIMPIKLTSEIAKSRAVDSGNARGHEFICFDGGEYKNQKTKCIFRCEKHGNFTISHDRAIRFGCPCPKCNTRRNRTKEEAEEIVTKRANELNLKFIGFTGDYKNQKSRIILNCAAHGDFYCSITNFINKGSGCWSCGGTKPISKDDAMLVINEKCKEKGVNFVCVIGNETPATKMKLKLNCSTHGDYFTTYINHVYDSCSCPKCSGNGFDLTESIMERLKEIEKEKNIKISNKISSRIKIKDRITMICGIHGEWECCLNNVLSGSGCPLCSKSGFKPNKSGFAYLLVSSCNNFAKIGITNEIKRRIRELKASTPFEFNLLKIINFDIGYNAENLEKIILNRYESAKMSGFSGATEWLNSNDEIIKQIELDMEMYNDKIRNCRG